MIRRIETVLGSEQTLSEPLLTAVRIWGDQRRPPGVGLGKVGLGD